MRVRLCSFFLSRVLKERETKERERERDIFFSRFFIGGGWSSLWIEERERKRERKKEKKEEEKTRSVKKNISNKKSAQTQGTVQKKKSTNKRFKNTFSLKKEETPQQHTVS